MELEFSDEQLMLAETTRRLCEQWSDLSELREVEGRAPGYSPSFWQQLVDIGLAGLSIPTASGGLGLGALECVAVYEQFGRCLAASPHHASSILAASLLASEPDAARRDEWLSGIAAGTTIVSVASLEAGNDCSATGVQLKAARTGSGWVLNGAKHFVPFASVADALIVLARADVDRVIALIVDTATSGVGWRYQHNLAGDACFAVTLEDVEVPSTRTLHDGEHVWPHWERAMSAALIPLAAQAIGAAACVHELSVAYAKERCAFGRPIGGFQAIAHYLAEVAVEIEGSRTLVHQAAWAQDSGRPFSCLAAMAKLQAGAVFRHAAAVAMQVHGGLGYTTQADPQLFFRRAKQWQLLPWDERHLEERIASHVLEGETVHV